MRQAATGPWAVAEIIPFQRDCARGRPSGPPPQGREIVVFPRTNIRVLRRLWGLPESGQIVAGPDGRAIGARRDDASLG
jgi:hypothetical protein